MTVVGESTGSMGSEIRRFTDLDVWRKAHRLFVDLYSDMRSMRREAGSEEIASQVLRCAGSVGANIAEGFNRSQKRFVNALDIALGEANEAESWLYKLRDADLLEMEVATKRLRAIIEVQRMLTSLKRKIAENADAVHESPAEYDAAPPADPFTMNDE